MAKLLPWVALTGGWFLAPLTETAQAPLLAAREACGGAAADSSRALPNDNTAGAGQGLRDGVLALQLVARQARWHPEGPQGPEVGIYAFAEEGCVPQIPGPLVRVPVGTTIHATIRNALSETLRLYGFQERPSNAVDSLEILPGESRELRYRAGAPGTYLYWGRTTRDTFALGQHIDGQLTGAIVVDSAGGRTPGDDRILVIGLWRGRETTPGTPVEQREEVLVVNGLSWPHTERLTYTVGDTVHWRVVNASRRLHPMHLHGFYYRVDARGTAQRDTTYSPADRRQVVTERLAAGTTMSMTWSPHTPGNWLFHCHLVEHMAGRVIPRGPHARAMSGAHHNHALEEMAGLVVGITVRPRAGEPVRSNAAPRRAVRLFVTERAGVFGALSGLSFVTQEGPREPAPDSLRIPGSPIVLTRGEPAAITVLNRTREPVGVHWHGIELESYFDGVGGWSGAGDRVAPVIAPGDSFVVRITPRRAGTFMYHTHTNEVEQMGAGLFAPLLVLEPGEVRDTLTDRILVLGRGGPMKGAPPSLNGQTTPVPIELRAGTTYRLRVISISPDEGKEVALLADTLLQRWRPTAKDGAALPPHQATPRPARVVMGTGETWDIEYTATTAQELVLQIVTRSGLPPVRTRVPVRVLPR